jgi:hypothetical protein
LESGPSAALIFFKAKDAVRRISHEEPAGRGVPTDYQHETVPRVRQEGRLHMRELFVPWFTTNPSVGTDTFDTILFGSIASAHVGFSNVAALSTRQAGSVAK